MTRNRIFIHHLPDPGGRQILCVCWLTHAPRWIPEGNLEWYPGETINFLEEKEKILVMVTQTSYKKKVHLVAVTSMFQTLCTYVQKPKHLFCCYRNGTALDQWMPLTQAQSLGEYMNMSLLRPGAIKIRCATVSDGQKCKRSYETVVEND